MPAAWREATVVLVGCLAFLAAIHYVTVSSILESWSRDPLAHGYFVVPLAAGLAWIYRARLRAVSPRPSFAALGPIAALSFVWLLGNLTQTTQVEHIAVVLLSMALIWGVIGTAAARAMIFPLGVLLFALPLGERIAPVLQELTARLAMHALNVTGVPAVLSGSVIAIPGTRWHVSEACGGINYLTASLMVGYVYAGAVYREWRHRIAFVFASALTPVAGNLLRVYSTILLDHAGATGVASGMRHNLYGLVVFIFMMVVLFVTCGRWREAAAPGEREADALEPDPVAPGGRWRTAVYATAALLMVASAPASARILWATPDTVAAVGPNLPIVTPPWHSTEQVSVGWTPPETGRSASLYAYTSDAQPVHLQIASYGADEVSGDLVSDGVARADPLWWPAADRHRSIDWRGRTHRVHEIELRSAQDSLLVWYWYAIDGRTTDDDYLAKLLLARGRLFRRPRGGDRIAVFTEQVPDVDAVQLLQEFVSSLAISAPADE